METLIVGLVLAACSALAFVAYNHHSSFTPVAEWLRNASFVVILAICVWDTSETWEALSVKAAIYDAKDIPAASKPLAVAAVSQATKERTLPMLNIGIGFAAWFIYLSILRFLPNIIDLNEKQKDA